VQKARNTGKQIDALAAAAQAAARTKLEMLRGLTNPQARQTANDELKTDVARDVRLYSGTAHEDGFKALEIQRQELEVSAAKKEQEQKAQELKNRADGFFDAKQYQWALNFYKGILAQYGDTAVAGVVRDSGIIANCEQKIQSDAEESKLFEEALSSIRNIEMNRRWALAKKRLQSSQAGVLYPENARFKKKIEELDAKIAAEQ
jgi:hypothetical protein